MASGDQAGDYEPGALNMELRKKTGAATVKGQVLSTDASTGGLVTAPNSGALGPFYVAVRSGASADTIQNAGVEGIYYLVADGAIHPNQLVMPSTTTAGRVIAYAATGSPTAGTATTEFRMICGTYLGKVDENDGKTVATDAAQGDIIRVSFEGGA
jgi:hypothetical protein